jgi:hypothetical protein
MQNPFALKAGAGTRPETQDTILAGACARGYWDVPANDSGKYAGPKHRFQEDTG